MVLTSLPDLCTELVVGYHPFKPKSKKSNGEGRSPPAAGTAPTSRRSSSAKQALLRREMSTNSRSSSIFSSRNDSCSSVSSTTTSSSSKTSRGRKGAPQILRQTRVDRYIDNIADKKLSKAGKDCLKKLLCQTETERLGFLYGEAKRNDAHCLCC